MYLILRTQHIGQGTMNRSLIIAVTLLISSFAFVNVQAEAIEEANVGYFQVSSLATNRHIISTL